jgi:phage shock protein E
MKQSIKKLSLFIIVSFLSLSVLADVVWIDVRSEREYKADHIEGDINIPYQKIGEEISQYTTSKDTTINIYCQSGGRAAKATQTLEELGYVDVINHGTIADVRVINEMLPQ